MLQPTLWTIDSARGCMTLTINIDAEGSQHGKGRGKLRNSLEGNHDAIPENYRWAHDHQLQMVFIMW